MKKIFILTYSLLILWGCSNKPKSQSDAQDHEHEMEVHLTDAQMQNISISTTQIKEDVISQTLILNGKIDVPPQNLVSVSVALGGYLKSTKMLPGSHFNKGEVIAVMEDNQYIQLQKD